MPTLAEVVGPHEDDLVDVQFGFEPDRVLEGYRNARFPMWLDEGVLGWFEPRWRALLRLEGDLSRIVHRSVLREVDRASVRIDTAFDAVLEACADPARPGAWIDTTFRRFYRQLYARGLAHSVECWMGGRLVGGCLGLGLGRCFVGESMVSLVPNASKVAFLGLVVAAKDAGYGVIDGQWMTEHLALLGFEAVARAEARALLRPLLAEPNRPLARGDLGLGRDRLRAALRHPLAT